MSPKHSFQDGLDRAASKLQQASMLTSSLFARVADLLCPRLSALAEWGKATHIRQLIEAGSHIDAALALIEIELPQWRLRHLTHDEGEWHCALSRQRNLPIELDDTAEGAHEDAAAAVLIAFVAALRIVQADGETIRATMPVRHAMDDPVCCDNFC